VEEVDDFRQTLLSPDCWPHLRRFVLDGELPDARDLFSILTVRHRWNGFVRGGRRKSLLQILVKEVGYFLEKKLRRAQAAAAKASVGGPASTPAQQREGPRGTKRTERPSPSGSSVNKPPPKVRREEESSAHEAPPCPGTSTDEVRVRTGTPLSREELMTSAESYSTATVGLPKKHLVVTVALKGDSPTAISRELWQAFLLSLFARGTEMLEAGRDAPDYDWVAYKAGSGRICSSSEEARDVLVDVISRISVADREFRAWTREELREHHITLLLPSRMREHTPRRLFALLMRRNAMPADELSLVSCDSLSGGSGERLLRLKISKEALISLKLKDGWVRVGIELIKAFFNGGPLKRDTVIE
jgi:hypothetical protein